MFKRLAWLIGISLIGWRVGWAESTNDYDSVQALVIPSQYPEKVFSPLTNMANFTVFSNVSNVRVEDGLLKFTLSGSPAILGWGNYAGAQAATNVQDLFEEWNTIDLRVKQSGSSSAWVAQWWVDGARMTSVAPVTNTLTLSGTMTNVQLAPRFAAPTPDGLELKLTGTVGDQFEIESIKMIQTLNAGYARKEFVLPTGTVWRAVATVGCAPMLRFGFNKMQVLLYINGQEVERRGARWIYGYEPVDISSYLQPGTNCVGFYGYRVGAGGYWPFLLFHTRIMMEDGQTVALESDTTWKTCPTNAAGWNQAGFDDSAWTNITGLFNYINPVKCYTNEYSVFRNSHGKDFFFTDDTNIEIEVQAPDGLESVEPVLDYTFSSADAEGKLTSISQGTNVSPTIVTNGSIVYTLALGQQARGVYAIACTLRGTNGVIEQTPPEPVVVIRKMNPALIQGTNAFEGLDVELEDEIDLTDSTDPHPWIEAALPTSPYTQPWLAVVTPTIVTNNGLIYRETAGYYFSYRFQFEEPGSFYLLELEYPDDADREFEVGIATKYPEMWSNDQSGVGAHTGGKFFKTGQMQILRFFPDFAGKKGFACRRTDDSTF